MPQKGWWRLGQVLEPNSERTGEPQPGRATEARRAGRAGRAVRAPARSLFGGVFFAEAMARATASELLAQSQSSSGDA